MKRNYIISRLNPPNCQRPIIVLLIYRAVKANSLPAINFLHMRSQIINETADQNQTALTGTMQVDELKVTIRLLRVLQLFEDPYFGSVRFRLENFRSSSIN